MTSRFAHAGLVFDRIRLGSQTSASPHCTLVFLHALLASRLHWVPFLRHLGRALSVANLQVDALLLDARNHGDSKHTADHRMHDMCADVVDVLNAHREGQAPVVLVGHSMGGKTALRLALQQPRESFAGLVSLDASPAAYKHTHANVFAAMHAVDFQTAKTKREVDEQMSHLLPVADRQFVISNNLAAESAQLRWRANHKTLADHSEAEVLAWDVPDHAQTDLPALFIGGGQSTRLTDSAYLARVHAHFTNAQVEMIPDASHFPHATHAPQTAVMMVNFLADRVLAARKAL